MFLEFDQLAFVHNTSASSLSMRDSPAQILPILSVTLQECAVQIFGLYRESRTLEHVSIREVLEELLGAYAKC